MSRLSRPLGGTLAVGLLVAATAVAAPQKLSVPVDGLTVPNVCADPPDAVVLSGDLDVAVNAKVGKGGVVSGKGSYNAGGVKGLGANGKYVGNGTGNFGFKVGEPFPAHVGAPGHFFLLQPGSGNDLRVSFLLHLTVHGDGSVSDPKIEIRKVECGDFGL